MKITKQQLQQIIKEELEEALDFLKGRDEEEDFLKREPPQNMHPLRQKTGYKGPALFRGLVGSDVSSIEDDPKIPEDHKRKLIDLYQSGPEGKKQAIRLMLDMGYGVEPETMVDDYDADSFASNIPFSFPDSAYKHRGMKDVEMRRNLRLESKLKITNEQLQQIIKEELEKITK